jgi:hypothetical protein
MAGAALILLLTRHFGLKPHALSVVGELAHRRKVVEFAGDPVILAPLLEQGLRPWLIPD